MAYAECLRTKNALERISTLEELALCAELRDMYNWWEAYETVAFFKINIGMMTKNETFLREAAAAIGNLCDCIMPKPYLRAAPQGYADTVKKEYSRARYEKLMK